MAALGPLSNTGSVAFTCLRPASRRQDLKWRLNVTPESLWRRRGERGSPCLSQSDQLSAGDGDDPGESAETD